MQRYILVRFLQSLLALWVMSVIVFSLARFTGDPLDVLLPMEAGEGERERSRCFSTRRILSMHNTSCF
jgi:ABC-type dipeptide/oligopeptide/nickel transport system permease component